jgi:hypothetical protein
MDITTNSVPEQKIKCCQSLLHFQIAYTSPSGHAVESFQGIGAPIGKVTDEERAFLHQLLDEYLMRRSTSKDPKAEDHFIVYRRWPNENA